MVMAASIDLRGAKSFSRTLAKASELADPFAGAKNSGCPSLGGIFTQVRFTGPGGVRFTDYVIALGNRFIVIEAKTSLPLAGRALARFGQQLRTFVAGTPSPSTGLTGTATEVIVITEETAAAVQASFAVIEGKVAAGTIAGVLQGTTELMMVLRGILIL